MRIKKGAFHDLERILIREYIDLYCTILRYNVFVWLEDAPETRDADSLVKTRL